MKFKYKTPLTIQIVFLCVCVVMALCTATTLLRLFGVQIISKLETGLGIVLLLVYLILFCISLAFTRLRYKITDKKLQLLLGFVDLFGGKIDVQNIVNAVMMDDKLYISYNSTALDPIIVLINVSKENQQSFCNALETINKQVQVFKQ